MSDVMFLIENDDKNDNNQNRKKRGPKNTTSIKLCGEFF